MRVASTFAVAIFIVAGLSAQQDSPKLKPELANAMVTTMQFDQARVSDALEALRKVTGVSIQIAPEIRDVVKNTTFTAVIVRNSTFQDALAAMIRPAGLTFRVIDEKNSPGLCSTQVVPTAVTGTGVSASPAHFPGPDDSRFQRTVANSAAAKSGGPKKISLNHGPSS